MKHTAFLVLAALIIICAETVAQGMDDLANEQVRAMPSARAVAASPSSPFGSRPYGLPSTIAGEGA